MRKALITDACHPLLVEGLEKLGFQVDYFPSITHEATFECIGDYEGLIINSKIRADRAFLERATQLKFIGRLGSGMEIVDQVAAAELGIAVHNSPEGNCNAVGEHVLGMLLALANKIPKSDTEVRRGIWKREENRGFELRGKKIGIVGFGHTGSHVAQVLAGFGVQVLSYDKYKKAGYASAFPYVQEVESERLQLEADIISFHLPLTEETWHLVNEKYIAACKHGVVLINASRGKVVDTAALVHSLENGRVGGACLDVFENERPETYTAEEKALYGRLFRLKNTVLSPHIGGWTHEAKTKMAETLLHKIGK